MSAQPPSWPEVAQPQDLVVTLLGSYVRGRLDRVWSGGLVKVLGEFGFSTGAARVALARLARHDLIKREKNGRHVSYVLSEQVEAMVEEGDRRILATARPAWDRSTLTVLWHTIPEEQRIERGRMARRLRSLGFGSPQDATWIGLGDREEEVVRIARELEVVDHTAVLVSRISDQLPLTAYLDRAWDVPALQERYWQFADYFGGIDAEALNDAEAFRIRTELIHSYRVFPSLDPGLPDELMAGAASRQRAHQAFTALYLPLQERSWRHFDRLVDPNGASQRTEDSAGTSTAV